MAAEWIAGELSRSKFRNRANCRAGSGELAQRYGCKSCCRGPTSRISKLLGLGILHQRPNQDNNDCEDDEALQRS